MLHKPYKKL